MSNFNSLPTKFHRDRELDLWDLDTGLNLAKQENAHARGITSVKLMGNRAVSSSKDKVRKNYIDSTKPELIKSVTLLLNQPAFQCVKLWSLSSDLSALFLLRIIGQSIGPTDFSPNALAENPNSHEDPTQWVRIVLPSTRICLFGLSQNLNYIDFPRGCIMITQFLYF